MRGLYLAIIKAIYEYAERSGDWEGVAELLVNINGEDSPQRDQDIVNLLSDFYFFVVYGCRPEEYSEGIRSWEDLRSRIDQLARSSLGGLT